ncbi:hypothetical protein BGZ68_002951 [Mortierella alpina]|nr:hypothetical protein BGZ68_002951 [Mortierella alpina]
MFLVDNFISFHDLSPDGCFLWASSSITACLGYEPEEIIGIPAYDVIHKDDIAYVKVTHQENVLNEMVGTQVILRFKHKNGSYVPCMVIFSLCYDYIVTCSTVIDQAEGTIRKLSAHSAAMTSLVGSKEQEFERIKRHHKAFGINTWNPNGLDPEPRACMILNRFSRNLGIMYASPSCELIFKLEPEEIVGRPFLLFIRSDDLATFVEQVDLAKSTNAVTHMRFWFQSPHCLREIPCEAMLFGAADGMIAIIRRCKPFVRRHLLTAGIPNYGTGGQHSGHERLPRRDGSSSEYFASSSSAESSFSCSPYTPSVEGNDGFSRHSTHPISPIHSNGASRIQNGSRSSRADSVSSTPSSSSYTSSTTSSSTFAQYSNNSNNLNHNSSYSNTSFSSYSPSAYSYRAPLRGLPVGSINSIRNLDREHSRLRPLTSLQQDDPTIVDGTTPLPEAYRMRTHHIQELDLDDDDDDDDDDHAQDDAEEEEEDARGYEMGHGHDYGRDRYHDQGYVFEYPYRLVREDVGHIDMDYVDDSGLDMELEELDLEAEPRAQLVELEDGEEIEELVMPRPSRNPERDRDRPGSSGSGLK